MIKSGSAVCVFALGIVFLIGCGGGGGDDVPRSSSAYMGSNMPAVLDSTSETQSLDEGILSDIFDLARGFGSAVGALSKGGSFSGSSDYVEGGDGGSATYEGSSSSTWDDTYYTNKTIQSLVFDNFADSSGVNLSYSEGSESIPAPGFLGVTAIPQRARPSGIYYVDLQAGRGSRYLMTTSNRTSDGIPQEVPDSSALADVGGVSGLVGSVLTSETTYYNNYNAFYTSEGYGFNGSSSRETKILQSGFTSSAMSAEYDSTLSAWSFEDVMSADYAKDYFYSYDDIYSEPDIRDYSQALMDFDQSHAWDLSTSTFVSSGTYCAEGDVESFVTGCVDFNISLAWDNDAQGEPYYCRTTSSLFGCYGQPEEGSIVLQADGASASFAYTPGGTTFIFDAGDGSAVFETVLPPFSSE